MLTQNDEVLNYKNFWLFYENLYRRLFSVINDIIDERDYNTLSLKEKVNDFLDSYSYYIIGKTILTEDNSIVEKETDKSVLDKLNKFSEFSISLDQYPSIEYVRIRQELQRVSYDISKLNTQDYKTLIREYYKFYNDIILIMRKFISIASLNGFLPNIKSQNKLKNIGYVNYDYFFKELENLKAKMSENTTSIKIDNLFKCRRCVYAVLIIFSPYFKREELFIELSNRLDFNFIGNSGQLEIIKKSYNYEDFFNTPKDIKDSLNNILIPLRTNVRLIKRYMSYEFGEIDMNPTIKMKYAYDPTNV